MAQTIAKYLKTQFILNLAMHISWILVFLISAILNFRIGAIPWGVLPLVCMSLVVASLAFTIVTYIRRRVLAFHNLFRIFPEIAIAISLGFSFISGVPAGFSFYLFIDLVAFICLTISIIISLVSRAGGPSRTARVFKWIAFLLLIAEAVKNLVEFIVVYAPELAQAKPCDPVYFYLAYAALYLLAVTFFIACRLQRRRIVDE